MTTPTASAPGSTPERATDSARADTPGRLPPHAAAGAGASALRPPPGARRWLPLPLTLALAALAFVTVASLALGSEPLSPGQVLHALLRPGTEQADVIVRDLRLPRTALGLLAGASLGLAGVLAQSITRNPLADPGILGVSSGAALAIVAGAAVGFAGGPLGTVALGFAGALGATALVFGATAVADRRRDAGASPATLPVIGVAASAALGAVTSALVLLDATSLDAYRFWAVGALSGRAPDTWSGLAPFALLGIALGLLAGRGLDAVALGDDLAAGLGVDVRRLRRLTVAAIALLTGTAVAAAGPLAFVGLLVAHTGRALVGPRHARLSPLAIPLGATAVLAADVIGRLVVGRGELAAGVVLGLIGGPLFVVLIARGTRR